MTLFHVLQIAFALAVVTLAVERCHTLFYRRALDAPRFRHALVRLLDARRFEDARTLVFAARPAHTAEVVWTALDPSVAEEERHIEAQTRLGAAEDRVIRGLRVLRIGASIGSVLGFIGAAIEIRWVFAGEHGLLGLQAGLVENIGLGRAALSIALGIATSAFALGTWGILRSGARELIADGRRALSTVEDLVEASADLERPEEKVQDSGTSSRAQGQSARPPS